MLDIEEPPRCRNGSGLRARNEKGGLPGHTSRYRVRCQDRCDEGPNAEEEVRQCAAAVVEVDDRVHRHAALSAELAELSPLQQAAAVRQTAAQAAADKIAQLTEQVKEAELIAAAAAASSTASKGAHTERLRLRTETDTRAAIRRFTSLFEPLIILVMGIIVGVLILSMLLAITSINDVAM